MPLTVKWGFDYTAEYVDADGRRLVRVPKTRNQIPQVGVDHLVGLLRGTATPISDWYLGLYATNYIPSLATSAADLPTNAGESTAYESVVRPTWNHVYDGVSDVNNAQSRAEFVFTTAQRIYGGFIVSSDAKGSGSGVLLSIVRFPSPVDVTAGGTLRILAGTLLVPIE